MSFAVSIANYSVEFCSRIIAIPEKYTHESALWPTMADKECRPSRISRNRSGSTTNPDHNMLWSMRTRRPPSSLCSRSAAIPSAEPTASERRRRRVRRVMGRSCAGSSSARGCARTAAARTALAGFSARHRGACAMPAAFAPCRRAPRFSASNGRSLLFRAAKVGIYRKKGRMQIAGATKPTKPTKPNKP